MFKIHNEILGNFEKKQQPMSSDSISIHSTKSVADQFALQLKHANKKLEEFILMLLDSFGLSEGSSTNV